MNRFLTNRPSREALAVALFIGAVFYGDVFLGITVPIAILLLPLILILRRPTLTKTRWSVPVGFVLLSCTAIPVLIQMLGGYGPRGKSDLVVYLPFVYAGLTMLTLAGWRVADAHLHRSLLAGGVLCTVLLAGALLFTGASFYFVPGQNPYRVSEKEEELQVMLGPESGGADKADAEGMAATIDALPPKTRDALMKLIHDVLADYVVTPAEEEALVQFAISAGIKPLPAERTAGKSPRSRAKRTREPSIPVSAGMQTFYKLKNRARTPLGMSNYLAVMFVFLFNVMLYQRSRWAILFAVLVLATMSRTGMGFLLISVAFSIAHRAGRLRQLIIVGAIGTFVCVVLAASMWEQFRALPGAESLASRAWYLDMAGEPIAAHPIAGTPRSETVRLFGYPITFNPHNSILHLLIVFGVIGTVAYAAYLAVVLGAFSHRARESPLWRGITAGTAVMLLWSLVEVIVLSPAFEVLIAGLYSLAYAGRPDTRAAQSLDLGSISKPTASPRGVVTRDPRHASDSPPMLRAGL